jgi:flagellar assembly protein FliH
LSRLPPATQFEGATRLQGWGAFGSLGDPGTRGGFRARFGESGGGWSPGRDPHAANGQRDGTPDPVEEAASNAFVEGFREGERVTREQMLADDAARRDLAQAIALVAGSGEGALASMLSMAVLRLVHQIMGEVPVDAETLTARCAAVAACIEGEGPAVLEVNPDDMPLLEGEGLGVTLAANPALGRGSVRLATSDGWIEDGPDVRLSRLAALLDDMEGRL